MESARTPRIGLRQYRILDVAIVDVVGTIGGAYVLSRYFEQSFFYWTLGLMVLAVPVHMAFNVDSQVLKRPWLLPLLVLPPYPI